MTYLEKINIIIAEDGVNIKKMGEKMKLNSYERLKALKDYKVVKSNDIIQKAKYELNKNEQKIFCYAVSKIKPDDPANKEYTIDVKEFCDILGLDYYNGVQAIISRNC